MGYPSRLKLYHLGVNLYSLILTIAAVSTDAPGLTDWGIWYIDSDSWFIVTDYASVFVTFPLCLFLVTYSLCLIKTYKKNIFRYIILVILILIFSSLYDVGGLLVLLFKTDSAWVIMQLCYICGSLTGVVTSLFRIVEITWLDRYFSQHRKTISGHNMNLLDAHLLESHRSSFLPNINANLFTNVFLEGMIASLIGLNQALTRKSSAPLAETRTFSFDWTDLTLATCFAEFGLNVT
jgi:hypothetical protein